MLDHLKAAIERVEAHVKNLKSTGAPHQQAHAEDLEFVVGGAKSYLNTPPAGAAHADLSRLHMTITELRGEIERRDEIIHSNDALVQDLSVNEKTIVDLRAQLDEAFRLGHVSEKRIAELEQTLASLSGLGIASTKGDDMADIKAGLAGGKMPTA